MVVVSPFVFKKKFSGFLPVNTHHIVLGVFIYLTTVHASSDIGPPYPMAVYFWLGSKINASICN